MLRILYCLEATPYSATDCAPPCALSLTITLATCGLLTSDAVNVILMVHEVAGASEVPQVLVCANSAAFRARDGHAGDVEVPRTEIG
jgi:hypothetical protein